MNNIIPVEVISQLPYGTMTMTLVADETEAVYYANGRTAYLFRSKIIDALYLFVPVLEVQ